MTPKSIKTEGNFLIVEWSDGIDKINFTTLRRSCPCAFCKKDREEHSEFYIPLFNDDQLKISAIQPVGGYAVNIIWKDGHNSGIYEYEFLKELALEEGKE